MYQVLCPCPSLLGRIQEHLACVQVFSKSIKKVTITKSGGVQVFVVFHEYLSSKHTEIVHVFYFLHAHAFTVFHFFT